jgi:aryl-alcohol dehydrogenase-like predicted oxidoreductase
MLLTTCAINIDYAIANKLTPFISMQNHYNLLYREEEREMFPTMKVTLFQLLFDY